MPYIQELSKVYLFDQSHHNFFHHFYSVKIFLHSGILSCLSQVMTNPKLHPKFSTAVTVPETRAIIVKNLHSTDDEGRIILVQMQIIALPP